MHKIPAGTLRDKLRGKYPKGSKPGQVSILTNEEESKIVKWLTTLARTGFPVTLKQLRINVGNFIRLSQKRSPFKNGIPGKKWVQLFLKRHPEVSLRKPSVLARIRATIKKDQIVEWFSKVCEYLKQEGLEQLLEEPQRIFNLDETACELVVRKRKCVALKNTKHFYSVFGNGDKESYTALFTASANGKMLPPLVLFPYKCRLPGEVIRTAPADWGIGKTDNGWMTGNAFYEFLKNIFQPWLEREKIALPVLLFVDGHRSHVTLLSTLFCKKNQIILICLYPNSTHLTQPLDVSFFGPMKKHWEDTLLEFRSKHGMRAIAKSEVCPLIKLTLDNFENMEEIIKSGFRRSGLYPWNPDAVNYGSMPTSESLPTTNNCVSELNNVEKPGFVDFEKRLTPYQLAEFSKQKDSPGWSGSIEDTNLFLFWKKWKNEIDSMVKDDESVFLGFPESESKITDGFHHFLSSEGDQKCSIYLATVKDIFEETSTLKERCHSLPLDNNANTDTEVMEKKHLLEEIFTHPNIIKPPPTKRVTRYPVVATSRAFNYHRISNKTENLFS
ncbi:uncharacterized protein LOC128736197 [Sabethes cyaneus]|uniref:uncharacterized protein LOC128736197 n=1 Tax=Sabethes cyaneus TaxID=53552 RepID=UPI00237DEA65|nr:uncharacterized protein LOC128736197 [Sabethes cyaneus]